MYYFQISPVRPDDNDEDCFLIIRSDIVSNSSVTHTRHLRYFRCSQGVSATTGMEEFALYPNGQIETCHSGGRRAVSMIGGKHTPHFGPMRARRRLVDEKPNLVSGLPLIQSHRFSLPRAQSRVSNHPRCITPMNVIPTSSPTRLSVLFIKSRSSHSWLGRPLPASSQYLFDHCLHSDGQRLLA